MGCLLRRALGAVGAVAAAAACSDEELWVDGAATSCAEAALDCATWFCPTCPYFEACDRHCGYCGACGPGEVEDCEGRCLAARDCALADYGYASCADWIGSGCCEAGFVRSDSGATPRFDCARFGCDGGDCEACAPPLDSATTTPEARRQPPDAAAAAAEDGDARAPWCVLLTATVCPAQGATHTVRRDPALRRADYEAALRRWAGDDGTRRPLVVVENSGAALAGLRAAAAPLQRAEFVSFVDGADVDVAKGKGHAEARAILRALADSNVLRTCDRVLKVTGRYFLRGLDAALAAVPDDAPLVVQSTPSPWQMWDGVLRSEVVGFRNDAPFVDALFAGQDEEAGVPMERVLFTSARALRAAGVPVATLPPLDVPPTPNAEYKQVITQL